MSTEISGLAGEIVAFTYPSIIKVADNQAIPTVQGGNRDPNVIVENENRGTAVPSGLARLTDGSGNLTSLAIGQNLAGARIYGPTTIAGQRDGSCNDKMLEICNGGVCIEDNIILMSNGNDALPNTLCGTTNSANLNVDCQFCVKSGSSETYGAVIDTNFCVNECAVIHDDLVVNADILVSGTDPGGNGSIFACGVIEAQGNIRSCQDIIAFYSSDKKLKNNIIKITDSNNVINSINGYEFDWNEKTDREGHDYGVIAQEVQKVAPTLVKKRADGYLSVDYIKLIPILIEEVKSLNNRIKVLEEK